ncbi:MAG: GNAT family N-acetyltransferase [Chloroflexota bacterium]|jgi:GNAT superfamily N-acetyltransferase
MTEPLTLRLMTEPEVHRLVAWAADEGWNPGLHDADVFWATDPEAFIGAELEGELIGGGAITSYGGEFGFMGLFMVRPEHRGRGLGSQLWHARVRLLQARLRPGSTIGLDGDVAMQDWYARGGFVFSHRTIRHEGTGSATETAQGLVPAAEVPFEELAAFDRRCFPAPREAFLRAWLEQPDSMARAVIVRDRLCGYGVVRRCGIGAKIGPLFADDAEQAEVLYSALASFVPGEPVYMDVPEVNHWAMSLARRLGMREVFGCSRMYLGPPPRLEESRIFGNTTFELG